MSSENVNEEKKIRRSSFTSTEQTFIELASSQRLSILHKLSVQNNKISNLGKDLNVTIQEVHRNINRLVDAGLVHKGAEGIFSLTTFGRTIIKQISTFHFLSRNQDYFSDHTLGDISIKFIQRIGALNNSDYTSGVVAVIEFWKQLYNESNEYIYGLLPQIPFELMETAVSKVKERGLKFRYILPQKAIVPKKRTNLLKTSGFYELLKAGLVERKMIDIIQVAVVLNEKQATVMFKDSKGQIDMNSIFFSRNISIDNGLFHEWCLDYFRDCWEHSRSFDERKLTEV
jgi:predicted transcriptional regulator